MPLSALVLALAIAAAPPPDLNQFLAETETLARTGKHAEALARHLWFHDHALELDPNMEGVRISFALSDWKKLGDVYPPALAALVATRDRKARQLLETGENPDRFKDVAAIDRTLEKPGRTVVLFQQIAETRPALAERCWSYAEDAVLAARRYDLAKAFLTDPLTEFDYVLGFYREMEKMDGTVKPPPLLRLSRLGRGSLSDESFVDSSVQLIRASLALGMQSEARQIQRQALREVDDRRLRDAIPQGLQGARLRAVPLGLVAVGLGLLAVWAWRRSRRAAQ